MLPEDTRRERVYLGLGANTGDPENSILLAVEELGAVFKDPRVSSLFRTLPRDDLDQPDFVNAVFTGLTEKDPDEVLRIAESLEKLHGRQRDPERPKGPRNLDIDILLYGELRVHTPDLEIPHPRIRERKFVLVPLLQLDPLLREPGSGKYYADYAVELEDQGIYYFSLKHYSTTLSWEDRAEGYGSKYGNKRKQ